LPPPTDSDKAPEVPATALPDTIDSAPDVPVFVVPELNSSAPDVAPAAVKPFALRSTTEPLPDGPLALDTTTEPPTDDAADDTPDERTMLAPAPLVVEAASTEIEPAEPLVATPLPTIT
jgi:hypothetical protein